MESLAAGKANTVLYRRNTGQGSPGLNAKNNSSCSLHSPSLFHYTGALTVGPREGGGVLVPPLIVVSLVARIFSQYPCGATLVAILQPRTSVKHYWLRCIYVQSAEICRRLFLTLTLIAGNLYQALPN